MSQSLTLLSSLKASVSPALLPSESFARRAITSSNRRGCLAVYETNIDTSETIAAEIRSNGAVSQSFHLDVTDPVAVQEIMQCAVEDFGALCRLVTAALAFYAQLLLRSILLTIGAAHYGRER